MDHILAIVSAGDSLRIEVPWWVAGLGALVLLLILLRRRDFLWGKASYFEVDEAEIGIGNNKLRFRANHDDLQVAFRFWTELSTRKIGMPIDEKNDVIAEVYDSWYEFFRVARELIKTIPATKYRSNESTRQIVRVSVLILNRGLRPHLTKWQARFRRWWEQALQDPANRGLAPQDIQLKFPQYAELIADLKDVNANLVRYAARLRTFVEK